MPCSAPEPARSGQTTFGSFVAQALATGAVAGWVFDPDELTVQPAGASMR